MKNKYIVRSRISEVNFYETLTLNIEPQKVSEITGVSRPIINKMFDKIRELIAGECEKDKGEIELDESYFRAKRVREKRRRGAKSKIPVFGMLKREGKVYTQIIKNCSMAEILPIIKQNVDKESMLYTDGFKTYDGLADFGHKKHYRIKHSDNEFALGRNHINGIETFWGLCKVRLSRFRGIHKHNLKECEFRYNNRDKNLYLCLCKLIQNNSLKLS